MSDQLTVGERSALLRAARQRIRELELEAGRIEEQIKRGAHEAAAALGVVALELQLLDRAVRKLWGEHDGRRLAQHQGGSDPGVPPAD